MIFLISYLICSGNSEKKITVKVFELAKHSLNLYRSYYFHKLSDSVNLWKNEAFHVQRVQSSRRKKLFEKHSSYIHHLNKKLFDSKAFLLIQLAIN